MKSKFKDSTSPTSKVSDTPWCPHGWDIRGGSFTAWSASNLHQSLRYGLASALIQLPANASGRQQTVAHMCGFCRPQKRPGEAPSSGVQPCQTPAVFTVIWRVNHEKKALPLRLLKFL